MNALGDEVLSFTTWGKRVVDKKLMAGSTADREIRKLAKMKMVVKQGNMYSKTALFPTADTQKTLPDAQTDLDFEMITSQIMPDNTKEKKQVSQKVSLANDTSDTNEKSRSEQLQTQKGKKK